MPDANPLQNVQPPLIERPGGELTAVVASLAIGGAERIVVEWAARVQPAWRPHIIVLRDTTHEWTPPHGVRVTRLGGVDVIQKLGAIGRVVGESATPVCVCHLLTSAERAALAHGGVFVVPTIHNAREGWVEDASAMTGASHVIAVSLATAGDLRCHGVDAPISVIRHLPAPNRFDRDARARFRRAWRIPEEATVLGMIGAVKPQKDYPFAIRLLRRLLDDCDVYLAILGGPVGRSGRDAWQAALDAVKTSGVRNRVAMPGFVRDAPAALPAFDALLNTSHYEGTSIATLEALVNGVPVVASRVGGQGELPADGLTLVDKRAPMDMWAVAVKKALNSRAPYPAWAGFPSYRLWTLAQLARRFERSDRVLFITANLNGGGAQRSLVNLATALRALRFEIAVTGDSTADYFLDALRRAQVAVYRPAPSRDAFDHAESLVARVCSEGVGVVCFWNVDPKIKLLVAKALAFTDVALVDVSPGPNSFDEMVRTEAFGRLIAFGEADFHARLDRQVVKYSGARTPVPGGKITVIPNGVPPPGTVKADYNVARAPRVVANGRIAPTKYLVEIVEAMQIARQTVPAAELHILGGAEPRHREYERSVRDAAGSEIDRTVFFHGASGDSNQRLAGFDLFVVLGKEQGCPNALLEALAAGLPCVANDDGGVREQVIDDKTGLLLPDRDSQTLARAVVRVLGDRGLAERLGRTGREHVMKSFSMDAMVAGYETLFASLAPVRRAKELTA